MNVRWRKVLVDLWSNKTRSLLVILSIAVGVLAVGVVASSYSIVKRDMAADYEAVHPHTARIFADEFDDDLVAELAANPGVASLEGRSYITVRIAGPDGMQHQVDVDRIAPLDQIRVDQLVFEAGSRDLGDGEIYLERQGSAGLGLKVGDSVDLILQGDEVHTLTIAGTVHDVNANPFAFTGETSGYVTGATMAALGGPGQYTFVTLVNNGSHTDVAQVRAVVEAVADRIRQSGREVTNINVNRPGQHPAQKGGLAADAVRPRRGPRRPVGGGLPQALGQVRRAAFCRGRPGSSDRRVRAYPRGRAGGACPRPRGR